MEAGGGRNGVLIAGVKLNAAGVWVRKALQRAHDKFADLLLDEIAQTIEDESADRIEAELRELDLLRYCQSALDRRRSRA